MQRLNVPAIYTHNVRSAFFFGYADNSNGAWGLVFVAFIHTLLLPATLTLGAGIKTLVDATTRKPLSEQEMSALKEKINDLNDEAFDAFISAVISYKGRSTLRDKLHALNLEEKFKLDYLKKQIQEEMRINKVKEFLNKQTDAKIKHTFNITVNHQYQFSKKELNQIKKKMAVGEDVFGNERRTAQRAAILNYLNKSINIGKKIEQHLANVASVGLSPRL